MMINIRQAITWSVLVFTPLFSTMSFGSTTDSQEIEVIEVTGKRPVSFFKKRVNSAELNFYELYNDITTNRKFKVECKQVARHSFSRIKERKCVPAFASIAMFEQMDLINSLRAPSEYLGRNPLYLPVPRSRLKVATDDYSEQQLNNIIEHLKTNPKLLERYNKLVEARNLYQERLELDEK